MKVACSHCGQYYEIDEKYAGQKAKCEKCGKEFVVIEKTTKKCPQCQESVHIDAIKCSHCCSPLVPPPFKSGFFDSILFSASVIFFVFILREILICAGANPKDRHESVPAIIVLAVCSVVTLLLGLGVRDHRKTNYNEKWAYLLQK